jgi:hypothetical protein
MKRALSLMRDHRRWLGALLVLVLGGALLTASVHHHDGRADHDSCVICTVAQTPAVAASATPAPEAPVANVERLRPTIIEQHARRVITGASSRAPPLA